MKTGGRAAVIVPDGVLFGSSKAHKTLRMLVKDHKLDESSRSPGVFKPYAGVSTAIVFFTKTGIGGTDNVWFYDLQNDGYSLDDKRNPIVTDDLPDTLARWADATAPNRTGNEPTRASASQRPKSQTTTTTCQSTGTKKSSTKKSTTPSTSRSSPNSKPSKPRSSRASPTSRPC